jgi:hypothetical protein
LLLSGFIYSADQRTNADKPAGEQLKQNQAYDSLESAISAALNTTFSQEQKLVPGLTATDSFGSDVAISGDTAVVGAPNDDIGTRVDQGSIFVFVRSGTTWTQQARLMAGDGAAGDNFGFSVAISLNTIVVGAPNDDNGSNTNQGSAYLFVRSGTTWTQQAKVTGLNQAGQGLGYDVTIDGDYAAISAKGATLFGVIGFVFVYHRVGTTWTQEEEIPGDLSQRTADDDFGETISLSGNTLVIGAPSRSTSFPAPSPCNPPASCNDCGICIFGCADSYCCPKNIKNGAAHIFVRSGTTWSAQQTLVGNATLDNCRRIVAQDFLGSSVAISGNTVVIGSSKVFLILARSGTTWTIESEPVASGLGVSINGNTVVYSAGNTANVLIRSGGTWSLQQSLTSGGKTAISGNTVLTGSLSFTKVFLRSGTTWSEQTELTAVEGATADQFGFSVAVDANTAVVGVPFKDVGAASGQGSVFVFKRTGATWQQQAEIFASDGAGGNQFGFSVAVEGETIAVGAPFHNSFRGAVYIFTFNLLESTWTQRLKITAADIQVLDLFGNSVALSGNTLVVGSPLDDNEATGTSDSGSAYVYTGSGATWTEQAKLRAVREANGDQFGTDVDIDGNTIVAGARLVDNEANTLQGAAYVFTRKGAIWTEQARLLPSDGASGDNFGQSVSVSGDTVAIGSPFNDTGANNDQGAAYVFTRSGSIWIQSKLTAGDGTSGDNFGQTVALQNDTLLVGATNADSTAASGSGATYVFTRLGSTWTEAQKLFALDSATNDDYGNDVALDDRTFLIGATNDTFGPIVSQGSAYVFVATGSTSWTGSNSADWSTGSNWDSAAVPSALDDVTIPGGGVTNEAVIDADVNVHDLTIGAGRSLTINAGRRLTVNGNLTLSGTITGGGTLVFNGATFTNNNSISGVNVQFGSGAKALNGNGSFFNNTLEVLSASTVNLVNSTMNRLVIDSGGALILGDLTLIGSGAVLINNGSFTAGTNSTVTFNGTEAQTTAGNVTYYNLTINNPAGVTIGADATVSNTLTLTNGDLRTGLFILTMPAAATSTGTTDVLGNVRRTGFTTINTLSFGNPFNTIRFTSGTPPADVTVTLIKQPPGDFTNAVRRTYTITPNGGSSFAATVRLHYQDAELNSNTEATLGLWRKGASWANLGATTRSATDNWVELAGIAQFSPWVISGPAAPVGCNYSISPTGAYLPSSGGPAIFNVTAGSSCAWSAQISDAWLFFVSDSSGAGNGSVSIEARENFTSSARQGVVTVGNQSFVVVQEGVGGSCDYSISPVFANYLVGGSSGSFSLTTSAECGWQAVSTQSWLVVTSTPVGLGNSTINYTVSANTTGATRTGEILAGGQTFKVKQKGS